MKEIEKIDPKQNFLDQFEKAFGDDFLPKEWSQDKKNRVAAETTSGKIKTGMVTSIPMICYGEKCAFKDQCGLYQQDDHPLGKQCPYEMGMVKTLMADYADSLEIDINDITEFAQVRDLINLDVQFMRAAKYLSKESFIQENTYFGSLVKPLFDVQKQINELQLEAGNASEYSLSDLIGETLSTQTNNNASDNDPDLGYESVLY